MNFKLSVMDPVRNPETNDKSISRSPSKMEVAKMELHIPSRAHSPTIMRGSEHLLRKSATAYTSTSTQQGIEGLVVFSMDATGACNISHSGLSIIISEFETQRTCHPLPKLHLHYKIVDR